VFKTVLLKDTGNIVLRNVEKLRANKSVSMVLHSLC